MRLAATLATIAWYGVERLSQEKNQSFPINIQRLQRKRFPI